MTCNECCCRTANLQDVLDIDEKHLSSKDERPEMLSFATKSTWGIFAIFNI